MTKKPTVAVLGAGALGAASLLDLATLDTR
jgi:hypothetical protein